jgi:hypothetical protein
MHRMKSSSPSPSTVLRLAGVFLALCASIEGAFGLGFGGISAQAVLGQPLNLSVQVRVEPGEWAEAECVAAEVSFGDVTLGPGQVRTQWDPPAAGLEQILRVRTLKGVSEPIVTVDLTIGCKARLQRQFVVLADPPGLAAPPPPDVATPAPAAPAPAAPRRAPPAVAAVVSPPAAPATADSAVRPSRRTPARPRETRPAASQEQPRLRLDPLDAELFSAPSLRIVGSLGSSDPASPEERQAAAALWKALNTSPEQAARESERMRQLEESLAALRQESAATRQALESLQASLREAQQQRYANPLVYLLAAVCVVLAAALVWMARQRSAAVGAWWRGSAVGSLPADLAASAPVTGPGAPAPAPQDLAAPSPSPESAPVVPLPPAPPTASPAPAGAAAAALTDPPAAPEKVAVEELIDLEQQAEFFLALGQEESAIELLQGHLRDHRDPSPLLFLKLLEIHKRRGDREAYEAMRRDFNQRFNAYAPSWDEDLAAGRCLEDYPNVIVRLQRLWDSPVRSLEVLQASLLRGDGDAKAFDLPAYRELLMLYGIARDRVQLDSTGKEVDLLLPLDEPEDPHADRLEPTVAAPPAACEVAHELPKEDAVDVHLDNLIEFTPQEPEPGAESDNLRQG